MGTSLIPFTGEKPLDNKLRKCDGKSLADYYMAIMFEDEPILQDMFSAIQDEDKIIKHDFSKKYKTSGHDTVSKDDLASAIKELDKFIKAEDKDGEPVKNNNELKRIVINIKKIISEYNQPLIDIMGRDVTQYRDGALDDCDDILKAIEIAVKNKSFVHLSIG